MGPNVGVLSFQILFGIQTLFGFRLCFLNVAPIRKFHSPNIPAFRTQATLIGRVHFTIMFSVPASFRQIFWHTPVDFGVLHPHKKATYTKQRFKQVSSQTDIKLIPPPAFKIAAWIKTVFHDLGDYKDGARICQRTTIGHDM